MSTLSVENEFILNNLTRTTFNTDTFERLRACGVYRISSSVVILSYTI